MKKISISLMLLIISLFPVTSSAQQMLSLEQCRQLAIENNKALKVASEQERVAYYEKKEALTKYFPEISFMGGYLRNEKNLNLISSGVIGAIPPVIPIPGVGNIPIDPSVQQTLQDLGKVDIKNVWAGGFNLVQPIFMGGKIIAYNDLRSYAEDLAKTMKDTRMTDVLVEVDNAYWQTVSIANKKRLAESYVKLMQKMESDISAMEEEGVATKADKLSVSVKLNEAEMTLTKAQNGLSLSKMLLSQLCGLEISDHITLKDEDIDQIPIGSETTEAPNIDAALVDRTEIKSLVLATKIYEQQEKIAKADFMPNLAFTANYVWTNPNLFDGFEKKFGGMWNVGLILKVPLNFTSSSAKLNVAKANTRIKKLEVEEAKEKIKLQINQSSYKLSEAYKKYASAQKNVEKANENLRYANVGFEEGVIAASDAMAAQTAWMSSHSELIDAQIDVMLCRIYLNKALGRKL